MTSTKQQHLFDKYASEGAKKTLCNKIISTECEVDGVVYNVQYLGRTVEYDSKKGFQEKWIKEFMDLVNWLVEEELIFHGVLVEMIRMRLMCKTKDGRMAKDDGTIYFNGVDVVLDDKPVQPSELIHREMILLYPLTKFTREELNERIREDYFAKEGALPPVWKSEFNNPNSL